MSSKNFGLISVVVTTKGTAVQVSSTITDARDVIIQPKSGNTGYMYVGGPTDVTAATGIRMANTDVSISFTGSEVHDYIDLTQLYIDSAVNGEGVNVLWRK